MTELFPGLHKLSGGKKQHWFNQNLDLIAALAEVMPFEQLCKALNCKGETMVSVLRRAESRHRPLVTRADRAMLKAERAMVKADVALSELHNQAEVLESQMSEFGELKQNLASYFGLIARASTMMEQLVSSVGQASDLTYHI